MDKFTTLEGVAAPLKIINVDTDMIIPKQYLKTIKRTVLGTGLFSEQRYKDDGSENPDFILNKPAYRNAKVLVAGDNFGCGSSREHAPWALLDFGIRCVISTSFGDIFYNNCFKNGILPIRVTQDDLDKLFDDAERGANATLTIDLANQEIRGPDGELLTVIEVLSPANKLQNRQEYLGKQRTLREGGVNLVEIDLLRQGLPTALGRPDPETGATYCVSVYRSSRPRYVEVYPLALDMRLPAFRVPLRPEDEDAILDLQPLIDRVHETGRYWKARYQSALQPPLSAEEQEWTRQRLSAAGLLGEG